MAKPKLKSLADLKGKFAHYEDYEAKLHDLSLRIAEINRLNKDSAGHDAIGKKYHEVVDKPTDNLTATVKYIGKSLGRVTTAGKDSKDITDKADEDAGGTAGDW
ncbi:hypothetical protein ACFWBF_11925 [Streptomyces sp. NPDC060028]|uniref:hypothetical protein n=1 Tax=Streptomyces sp. NPDC060028 TaxID=3347041 RepID=UPI0036AD01CE